MGKSSYNKQQKKGRATLTLLHLIFLYSIGNYLVKVVSIASMISTFYFNVSDSYLSCISTVNIMFMGYMHLLAT